MKKMLVFCLCGIGFVLEGADLEGVHRKNIETAIVRFSSTLTNNIESMDYDFSAILGEMENIKSSDVYTNLLSGLTKELCTVFKDVWKHKNAEIFQWKRVHLMGMAMSIDVMSNNVLTKWGNHLDLLKAMRTELALYADAEGPEVYRRRWLERRSERRRHALTRRNKLSATNGNMAVSDEIPLEESPSRKWGYKKDIEYQIARYEKHYFDSLILRDDYMKSSPEDRVKLMRMIKQGLGRYPKWYKKEMDEAAAGRKAGK